MAFPTREHIEAAQQAADYWKAKTGVYVWPSVTLAQALIESAGWTKLSGKNNGFGVKANASERAAGKASYVWTTEVIAGNPVKVQQWFADYDTLKDAYIAHGRVLATVKAYKSAWAAKDAKGFVEGIGAYATAPNYRSTILSVMSRLKLEQYDMVWTPPDVSPAKPKPPVNPTGAAVGGGLVAGTVATIAPHLHLPGVGVIAAFVLVAGVVGAIFFISRAKSAKPAQSVPPAPEVIKLLDELAPIPPKA